MWDVGVLLSKEAKCESSGFKIRFSVPELDFARADATMGCECIVLSVCDSRIGEDRTYRLCFDPLYGKSQSTSCLIC
jgi:hypothetical protein